MKKSLLFLSVFFLTLFSFVGSARAADARTNVNFTTTSKSGVAVYPYLSADKRWLYLDFSASNLASFERFYYNVNYDTNERGTLRGAEGHVIPVASDFKFYKGVPYVRKAIRLGTCSKNVCKYDANPRKFRITVNSKLKNAKSEVSKVLTFN